MSYLFWSFAIVWIALFLYVRGLVRRTGALEDEVRRLTSTDSPGTVSESSEAVGPSRGAFGGSAGEAAGRTVP